MGGQFAAPKGVAEYAPPQSEAFRLVRDILATPPQQSGYSYIELPIFEDTNLFVRGVGESTDVVGKEMYTFTDRGDRSLTLRPEGTASVVRAAIEHNLLTGSLPVKLWYAGPFFRAERPQQGRYRQFSQVGVEALGVADPALDAEVIAVADQSLRSLGLSNFRLQLNCLGDAESRTSYRAKLVEYLRGLDLDEATSQRAELNPLRVLDDKRPQLQQQLDAAPLIADSLTDESRQFHEAVKSYLADFGVAFSEAPRLVRGLDYYTGTTFEFVHDGLGAQSAIGGGGRYDSLIETLGGPDVPGIGYALGVDRILLACESEGIDLGQARQCDVYCIALGEQAKHSLAVLVGQLRRIGIPTDMTFGDRGMKGAMRAADRSGARVAIVAGDRDIEAGVATVKDLATGNQSEVRNDEVLAHAQQIVESRQ